MMLSWMKLPSDGKMPTGLILVLAVVGVLLIFGADWLAPAKSPVSPQPQQSAAPSKGYGSGTDYELMYEQSLRETISAIAGTGEVIVDVFLASSSRAEYARSLDTSEKITQNQAESGSVTQQTTESRTNSQVTLVRSGSWEEPIVVQTFAPEIQGVLVIAEGAANPRIKLELTRAVCTALDIPAHRVRVLSKEGK
ncbi:MAG: hypothetical protein GX058_07235 [Firmicutes bacterium]|nr:hypothetical protein [Bacillota bacterium]